MNKTGPHVMPEPQPIRANRLSRHAIRILAEGYGKQGFSAEVDGRTLVVEGKVVAIGGQLQQ